MTKEGRLETRVARLARMGRARDFDRPAFTGALRSAARGGGENAVLRRLLAEWTGLDLGEDEIAPLWERVLDVHDALRGCLGEPVSLQTALLHEVHTRRGLLPEPRLVPGRELMALQVSAITDPLTGLYNRRFLHDHLERELSRAERTGSVVSVVLMDLKGFKGINDRLGHPVGDDVLVRTARSIRESLRVVDAGCRYGGDEFVAVLPNTDVVNSLAVAERIRQRVSRIRLPLRVGLGVGLNYGVATYPTDGRTIGFLLKVSDVRLYSGRSREAVPHGQRRYPRFSVQGVTLSLLNTPLRPAAREVQDIGYGGLSFTYPKDRLPPQIEGEIAQKFSPETHPVAMKPVSVVPQASGRVRVGCAFVH